MDRVLQIQQQLLRWKRLPLAAISLAVAVLGAIILSTTLNLRTTIRGQLVNHDGEILQAISRLQQYNDEANGEVIGSFDDPAEQFNHILKISRMKGVLGIRLFTRTGSFTNSFPAYIPEAALSDADLTVLQTLHPASHYLPEAPLAAVDLSAELLAPESEMKPVPILEVNVPLQAKDQSRLAGIAQFIIDGQTMAAEFSQLDRRLTSRALAEFATAGGLLALGLHLAFRRLRRAHQALTVQARRLLLANQELALAAKTSAVGAVTSHLIHGLKNPLSGLRGFVKNQAAGAAVESAEDWRDAMASTERMQALIGGVVRVLEDQQAVGSYEISLRELVEIITARLLPVARAGGVHFHTQLRAEGLLGNRDANLTILILENLIQNALQATPEGKSVRLIVHQSADRISCEVHDQGSGFPVELRSHLFQPCRSTKTGGSGIGLAISRQLARNIGGELELASSSAKGCIFCLALPLKLILPALISADQLLD